MNGSALNSTGIMEEDSEEAIAALRDELESLQNQQITRQQDLVNLEANLAQFERTYNDKVGVRLALLDKLKAELAELAATLQPENAELVQQAVETRARATESAQSLGREPEIHTDESDHAGETPKSTEDSPQSQSEEKTQIESEEETEQGKPLHTLKSLWRQVSKYFHPDLVQDQKDKDLMTYLMREANSAYERGDRECLEALLKQGQDLASAGPRARRLLHLSIIIDQVHRELELLESQIAAIKERDVYLLKQRVDDASAEGIDLLARMSEQIDEQIADIRQQLAQMKDAFAEESK